VIVPAAVASAEGENQDGKDRPAHARSTIIPRGLRHVRFILSVLFAVLPVLARAETDLEAGERLYQQAKSEEERLEFSLALRDYEASVLRAPSGRWALAARARAEDLRAHAEGNFEPLVQLERARRAPQTSETIDDLERRADAFPEGRVRGEARMLGAEAYLDRLGRKSDGERMLRLIIADKSADDTLKRFAARRLTDLSIAEGKTKDALETARIAGDHDLERKVARTVRRILLRRASMAIVLSMFVLTGLSLRRKGSFDRVRGALRLHGAAIAIFAIVAGAGGAALASAYESGHGTRTDRGRSTRACCARSSAEPRRSRWAS